MSLQTTAGAILSHFGVTTTPGSFGLHATRAAGSTTNALQWTWPANILAAFSGGVHMFQLTVQRSTNASNRPNSAVVYFVGGNQAPAADMNWATVKTWNYAQFIADPLASAAPGSYSDDWPSSHPVIYRLILNIADTDPVAPPFSEMTWNTALVIPQQKFCFQDQNNIGNCVPQGGQIPVGSRTLIWDTPDVSWFPAP